MIKIAIVEDEKETQELFNTFIKRFESDNQQTFHVTNYDDGLDILDHYQPVDIIFMDINMKHLDGMETAQRIRSFDAFVVIIFVTTMAKYAIKGYEVDALDFVLKPIEYVTFSMKLQKAINRAEHNQKKKYIMVPLEDRKERISTDDVEYIEVKGHYLYIVTEDQTYEMRSPLKAMESELQGYHFERCNNSFLVNLKNVKAIDKDSVIIGNHQLPISRHKKKRFLEALSNYLMGGYNQ